MCFIAGWIVGFGAFLLRRPAAGTKTLPRWTRAARGLLYNLRNHPTHQPFPVFLAIFEENSHVRAKHKVKFIIRYFLFVQGVPYSKIALGHPVHSIYQKLTVNQIFFKSANNSLVVPENDRYVIRKAVVFLQTVTPNLTISVYFCLWKIISPPKVCF